MAQIKSLPKKLNHNIEKHRHWVEVAISEQADLIIFPELSLSAYEPKLAQELAMEGDDSRLELFQKMSDRHSILIGLGLPTKSSGGILISTLFFQAQQKRKIYSKQKLHADEKPYFIEGKEALILELGDQKIAPAICYESLLPAHAEKAYQLGANVYLGSLAKSQKGMEKVQAYFPQLAKKYSMWVLMANAIGQGDGFECAGQSSVWDSQGNLTGRLGQDDEGLLICDIASSQTYAVK